MTNPLGYSGSLSLRFGLRLLCVAVGILLMIHPGTAFASSVSPCVSEISLAEFEAELALHDVPVANHVARLPDGTTIDLLVFKLLCTKWGHSPIASKDRAPSLIAFGVDGPMLAVSSWVFENDGARRTELEHLRGVMVEMRRLLGSAVPQTYLVRDGLVLAEISWYPSDTDE